MNHVISEMVGPVALELMTNRLWEWGRVWRDSFKRRNSKGFLETDFRFTAVRTHTDPRL